MRGLAVAKRAELFNAPRIDTDTYGGSEPHRANLNRASRATCVEFKDAHESAASFFGPAEIAVGIDVELTGITLMLFSDQLECNRLLREIKIYRAKSILDEPPDETDCGTIE